MPDTPKLILVKHQLRNLIKAMCKNALDCESREQFVSPFVDHHAKKRQLEAEMDQMLEDLVEAVQLERATVVLVMEGGVIQHAVSDRATPPQVLVIDYDCEGAADEEITPIPQERGGEENAVAFYINVETDEARVKLLAGVVDAHDETRH